MVEHAKNNRDHNQGDNGSQLSSSGAIERFFTTAQNALGAEGQQVSNLVLLLHHWEDDSHGGKPLSSREVLTHFGEHGVEVLTSIRGCFLTTFGGSGVFSPIQSNVRTVSMFQSTVTGV